VQQKDKQGTQGERTVQDYSDTTLTVPVVIVGAGPTGLTAANLLGKAGVQTMLLERNADLADCPRAISIDDEGLRICQMMELSDTVMRHMLLDLDAHYVSGNNYLARVSPTSRRNGYPLISTFHQPTFEATLLQGLERFPCVSVSFLHNLESFEQDNEGVTLLVRTPDETTLRIRCRYLLACDGGQSYVRHKLHIPMLAPSLLPSWLPHSRKTAHEVQTLGKLDQRWISVDCVEPIRDYDSMSRNIGYFFSDYRRPAVTLPSPFGGRRWEFLVHPHERPEEMLDDDTLFSLMQQTLTRAPQDICERNGYDALDEKMPFETFSITQTKRPRIIRRTFYTFHTAIAETFSQGRVFLLGDAAHLMPPFAGQGMNSGLRDAHNLTWKLRLVLCENAHPHLLETYHEERIPHVTQMTLFTSLPGRILTTPVRQFAHLRNQFFRVFNLIPTLRDAVAEMRVKPASKYAHGFFLSHVKKTYKKFVGLLLPQPYVTTAEGRYLLLDEVLGDGFALLKYCETEQESEELGILMNRAEWQQFGMRAICLHSAKHQPPALLEQPNAQSVFLATWEQPLSLLLHNPRLCLLIRPDRYILGIFDIHEAREAAIALNRLLQNGA